MSLSRWLKSHESPARNRGPSDEHLSISKSLVPQISKSKLCVDPASRLTGESQFRILDLLPGHNDDGIECEIRVSQLEDGEKYEALSYVWGALATSSTTKMSISGSERPITRNLYDAIKRLRYTDQRRSLWIDQICVNQWDKTEKAHQVTLMRRIYQNCSRCLIWLGEIPEDANFTVVDASAAFYYLRFISDSSKYPDSEVPVLLLGNDNGQTTRNAFQAVMLHGNPWWSRIWTIQEALLPPDAIMVWGSLQIPWSTVENAANNLSRGKNVPHKILQRVHQYHDAHIGFMYGVRGLTLSKAGETPLNVLHRWRYRDATDPLDKVYALVGLFSTNPFPTVKSCSYEISPAQLYSCVTLDLIENEVGLKPIGGRRGEPRVTPDLPSWAIDATCHKYSTRHTWSWWSYANRYSQYKADGGRRMTYKSTMDNTVLAVKGFNMDKISEVSDVIIGEEAWENVTDELLSKTVRDWRRQCMDPDATGTGTDGNDYTGGGQLDDAFWKTMLGERMLREFPYRRTSHLDREVFYKFLANGDNPEMHSTIADMVVNQRFFLTESGYIGLGPPNVEMGDEVWILFGGNYPFVLRPRTIDNGSGPKFINERILVGDAYVHGVMDGEFVEKFVGDSSEVFLF